MLLTRAHRSLALTAALAAGVALGCGPRAPGDVAVEQGGEPGVLEQRFGLVLLSYSENRANRRVADQLTGSAWFVEHELASREDVLSLLNAPLLGARAPVAEGTCRLTERWLPAEGATTGSIYFMDAGQLTVESEGRGMALASTYFPDVYPDVSGLVYDGMLVNGRPVMEQDGLRVLGHGSDEVGPFAAVVAPPEPLRLRTVGGRSVTGGRVLARLGAGGLEVTWAAAERDAEDLGGVVLEFVRRGFDRVATVSCSAADDGRFTLPADLLARLPGFGVDQTDRLNVYRYAAADFDAEGLGGGLVLVVARDAVFVD